MIVHDFHVIEIAVPLSKAYAVLIVDANAVLPLPISVQRFKSVCRGYPQIVQVFRTVNHDEFSQCYPLDSRW
jgi:hypothetical protein